MKVLVNALGVTNLSGRQVLLGHLSRLAQWTLGRHEFVVLFHGSNRDLVRDLGPNVRWRQQSARTHHWAFRLLWERTRLPGLARELAADLYFTPSGTVASGLAIPQVSMALNPWCLVPQVHRGPRECFKARCQRYAYRQTVRRAAFVAYASGYLRDAYHHNAGFKARRWEIVYPALDDETITTTDRRMSPHERRPHRIVSASLWAPHKKLETVLEALAVLRSERNLPAELYVVGGWSERGYESYVRQRVHQLQLDRCVHFAGHVSRSELLAHYAQAAVFCLMSWCESFGIPSIEAQAAGTPVVCANCCAVPEVCGEGGLYPQPGDVPGTVQALDHLLTDRDLWARCSAAAVENAAKFRYDFTTRPLLRMFEPHGAAVPR